MVDLLLTNGTLVIPKHGLVKADIAITNGKINAITQNSEGLVANQRVNLEGKYIFPGVIDAHTHFGMGSKETDYATESVSALVGGVTTILSFDLQSTPFEDTFDSWRNHAESQSYIDFGFHYGMVTDHHINSFETYLNDHGVSSYKFFMSFRGEEGAYLGLKGIDDGILYDLMQKAGKNPNTVVAVHPENIEIVWRLRDRLIKSGRDDLLAWNDSRPDFVETENIRRAMYFAELTNAKVYIPHVSCEIGIKEIEEFRKRYKNVIVETCPHYLTHFATDPLQEKGKVNPPLRFQKDADALWEAVLNGTVDVIGSDHVPRTVDKKEGGIWKASAGFPGCATLLPILLSEGHHKRKLPLERIAELTSYNPAKIFNLSDKKGNIAVGLDADLTIVDLDRDELITSEKLQSNAGYSLYEGWNVKGWVEQTYLRGQCTMKDGKIQVTHPNGRYLYRNGKSVVHS